MSVRGGYCPPRARTPPRRTAWLGSPYRRGDRGGFAPVPRVGVPVEVRAYNPSSGYSELQEHGSLGNVASSDLPRAEFCGSS